MLNLVERAHQVVDLAILLVDDIAQRVAFAITDIVSIETFVATEQHHSHSCHKKNLFHLCKLIYIHIYYLYLFLLLPVPINIES